MPIFDLRAPFRDRPRTFVGGKSSAGWPLKPRQFRQRDIARQVLG